MPRPCTVCRHDDRATVDKELVRGTPYQTVARRYGLDDSALRRHRLAHVPRAVEAAQDRQEARIGFDVVSELRRTYEALSERLEGCESDSAYAQLTSARLKAIQMARDLGVDLPTGPARYTVRLEMNPTGTEGDE